MTTIETALRECLDALKELRNWYQEHTDLQPCAANAAIHRAEEALKQPTNAQLAAGAFIPQVPGFSTPPTYDTTKWRLVPVEPTPEMKKAAVIFANGNAVYKNVAAGMLEIEESIYAEVYAAMLEAAPQPPSPDHSEQHLEMVQPSETCKCQQGQSCRECDPDIANGWKQPAEWVGLTDDEIRPLCSQPWVFDTAKQWVEVISNKLREKNSRPAEPENPHGPL